MALVSAIGSIPLLEYRKSHAEAERKLFDELDKIPGRFREFRYKDLKKATNNFSPTVVLGSGEFRVVYKGIMPKSKGMVAVKRMTKDSKRGKDKFISEISVIKVHAQEFLLLRLS